MPLFTVFLPHPGRENPLRSMLYGTMPSLSCKNGHSGSSREAGPALALLITKSRVDDAKRVFTFVSGMLVAVTSMTQSMDQMETI
jgi:hypothetical protein